MEQKKEELSIPILANPIQNCKVHLRAIFMEIKSEVPQHFTPTLI
jgi:hypothetical protein